MNSSPVDKSTKGAAMLAYHGKPEEKRSILKQLRAHAKADELSKPSQIIAAALIDGCISTCPDTGHVFGSRRAANRARGTINAAGYVENSGQRVIPGCEQSLPLDLDERYTTRETLAWCQQKAGVDAFDLDVAACEEAHCAPKWFDIHQDGLTREWCGRVWANPPFSNIEPWVQKAWHEFNELHCHTIAMLLPATRTEQNWWQRMVECARDIGGPLTTYFLPGRTRFGIPGNPEGIGVGSPPFGCVLLVWGRR